MSKAARTNTPAPVLILTHEYPPFRGGIGTYCEQLANAMAKLGSKVTIWAPAFSARSTAENTNPEVKRFTGGVFKHALFPKVLLLTLKAVLTRGEQLILAADWPFVAACGLLRRVLPFRYRIMLHGSEILFFRTSRILNLLTLGNPFYGAEVICANSHFTRNLLLKTYPHISPEIVRVTYLGMDSFWQAEKPAAAPTALLKRLGIPSGSKIILTVGRLHPRKGQAKTIAALSRLSPKLQEKIAYVMVGHAVDDAYHAELSALAAKAPFPAILAGAISNEDVRALYQTASVFCMPSVTKGTKVEGFGLVFLEAAGSGLPSIAVDAAAVPEVVKNNETGILVPNDEEAVLAEALQTLLTDDKLRTKLGANALAWAKTFTWQRCATQTLES